PLSLPLPWLPQVPCELPWSSSSSCPSSWPPQPPFEPWLWSRSSWSSPPWLWSRSPWLRFRSSHLPLLEPVACPFLVPATGGGGGGGLAVGDGGGGGLAAGGGGGGGGA